MDELLHIIHSLSKNEKRYISQFARIHEKKGKNQYLIVFELLSKENPEQYDEKAFLQSHLDEPWAKYFPQTKQKLKQHILEAMRFYHRENTSRSQLENLLADQLFLKERGAHDASHRMLKKVKKQAVSDESWETLLEINRRERSWVLERRPKEAISVLDKLMKERGEFERMISKENRRRELYERYFAEYRFGQKGTRRQTAIASFEKLISEEERTSRPNDSFEAKLNLLLVKAIHARIRASFQEFYQVYREIMALWASNKKAKQKEPKRHINIISNYANACHNLALYEEMKDQIELLKRFKPKTFELEAEKFQNVVHLDLLLFLNADELERGREVIQREQINGALGVWNGLEVYGEKINAARKRTIIYNTFVLFFFLEEYKEAKTWLDRLFDGAIGSAREDLKALAVIFEPVFWFERENIDLFDSKVRSARYTFKDSKSVEPSFLETIMVELLQQLKGKKGEENLSLYAKEAKNKLVDHYLLQKDQAQQTPVGLDEILYWLESKVSGKSIRSIAKEMKN